MDFNTQTPLENMALRVSRAIPAAKDMATFRTFFAAFCEGDKAKASMIASAGQMAVIPARSLVVVTRDSRPDHLRVRYITPGGHDARGYILPTTWN